MEKIEILVVDDEREMLVSYRKILTRANFSVQTADRGEQALEILRQDNQVALVISDLKMPGMDGMALLSHIKELFPHLPVIMVTGYGTLELGVEAVKNGAFDFIEKPFSSKKLLASITSALKQLFPAAEDSSFVTQDKMQGKSSAMLEVFDMIRKVSHGDANVLITGESGVGKELVARSIHKNSLRRNHPIIPINCGALPDQLFESELFGYKKGAFTGAFQSKPGLVELANGGTLFLDEICEMPQNLQVKMLRVLEDHKIRRIGGQKEIPVNIRVVSATNRDVELSLKKGWLREDFFYRINTIQIHIPPLRKRKEDIPILINHFLREFEQKYNRKISAIEPRALTAIQNYEWPGNVRELQNVIERSYYLASPPQIRCSDLPSYIVKISENGEVTEFENLSFHEAKEQILQKFEKKYLKVQLEKHQWNISQTAQACGIDRRTIHRLINKYDLKA